MDVFGPESKKWNACRNGDIGQFMDWLTETGFILAKRDENDNLVASTESVDSLIAEWFGVDLRTVVYERLAPKMFPQEKEDAK